MKRNQTIIIVTLNHSIKEMQLNSNLIRQQTQTAKTESFKKKSAKVKGAEWSQQHELTYLTEQRHVLHYKGDVKQGGETVEEVELRK